MTVAASHAALLLAQGSGRLLRRVTDRGVVAVLDSRMATARYGEFLRASLPPFWQTTNATQVRAALRRLARADAKPTKSARFRSFCVFSAGQARVTRPSSLLAASIGWRGSTRTVYPTGPASGSGVVVEKIS